MGLEVLNRCSFESKNMTILTNTVMNKALFSCRKGKGMRNPVRGVSGQIEMQKKFFSESNDNTSMIMWTAV